jgi:hypothetical protein
MSAIHNSAPRTLRRGDGVCRICSDIVVSSKSRPRLEAPSAGQSTPGAQGSIGVSGGIRGHCLSQTRTPAAWRWYLKPALRLMEPPSFLRILMQHSCPLPYR